MYQFLKKENKLEEKVLRIENELSEVKEQLKDLQKKTTFCVDRQYYFNSFCNAELEKLKYITDGGILLCGNYGDPNTGDEWMLDTMISYIRKYTNKNITIMLTANRLFDPSVYLKYNIDYIHCPQTIYDYDIIEKKFDTLIFGGGAIIEDEVYYEAYDYGIHICRTLVDLSLRFIAKNKKVFCIGLSTSEKLSNFEFIKKLQVVIDGATYFSLRDPYSLDTLKKAGLKTEGIKIIPDIVYANEKLQNAVNSRENVSKRNIVKIGLVYIVNEENRKSFEKLLEIIKQKYEDVQQEYLITIIPFYDCWHIDYKFYSDYVSDTVKLLPYDSDIEKVINEFLNQDIMVCARYHAILLAACLGIPCVPLYYDRHPHYRNKVLYLLQQFGKTIDDAIAISNIDNIDWKRIDERIIISDEGIINEIIDKAKTELNKTLDIL